MNLQLSATRFGFLEQFQA